MGSARLPEGPAASRFLGGGIAEAEALLGSPVAAPAPPRARRAAGRLLRQLPPAPADPAAALPPSLLAQIGIEVPRPPAGARRREPRPGRVRGGPRAACCARRAPADRRLGLPNLFWLAHTPGHGRVPAGAGGQDPGGAQGQVLAAPAALLLLPAARPGRAQGADGRGPARARPRRTPPWSRPSSTTGSRSPRSASPTSTSTSSWPRNKRYRHHRRGLLRDPPILLRETERRLREGDRGPPEPRRPGTCPACPRTSTCASPASSRS